MLQLLTFSSRKKSITDLVELKVKRFVWWEKFINGEAPESGHVENLRMSRKRFEEINEKFRPFLEKLRTNMRQPIPTAAKLAQNSNEAEL